MAEEQKTEQVALQQLADRLRVSIEFLQKIKQRYNLSKEEDIVKKYNDVQAVKNELGDNATDDDLLTFYDAVSESNKKAAEQAATQSAKPAQATQPAQPVAQEQQPQAATGSAAVATPQQPTTQAPAASAQAQPTQPVTQPAVAQPTTQPVVQSAAQPATGQTAQATKGGNVAELFGVTKAKQSQSYGAKAARYTNWGGEHKGVDYDVRGLSQEERAIKPQMGGVVLETINPEEGAATGYGRGLVVKLDNGEVYRLGHNESIDVQPGQRFEAGQKLGTFGEADAKKSGMSDFQHIHAERFASEDDYKKRVYQDPNQYKTEPIEQAAATTPENPTSQAEQGDVLSGEKIDTGEAKKEFGADVVEQNTGKAAEAANTQAERVAGVDEKMVDQVIRQLPENQREAAREAVPMIAQALKDEGILNSKTLGYAVATASHESGMVPKEEILAKRGLNARNDYIANLQANYEGGADYKGRGYIQLTHKGNYEKYGQRIGEDLVNNPDLLLDPKVSAKVMAAYMKDTGVADAVNAGDYDAARVRVQGRGALNPQFIENTRAIGTMAQNISGATGEDVENIVKVPEPQKDLTSQIAEQQQQEMKPRNQRLGFLDAFVPSGEVSGRQMADQRMGGQRAEQFGGQPGFNAQNLTPEQQTMANEMKAQGASYFPAYLEGARQQLAGGVAGETQDQEQKSYVQKAVEKYQQMIPQGNVGNQSVQQPIASAAASIVKPAPRVASAISSVASRAASSRVAAPVAKAAQNVARAATTAARTVTPAAKAAVSSRTVTPSRSVAPAAKTSTRTVTPARTAVKAAAPAARQAVTRVTSAAPRATAAVKSVASRAATAAKSVASSAKSAGSRVLSKVKSWWGK